MTVEFADPGLRGPPGRCMTRTLGVIHSTVSPAPPCSLVKMSTGIPDSPIARDNSRT